MERAAFPKLSVVDGLVYLDGHHIRAVKHYNIDRACDNPPCMCAELTLTVLVDPELMINGLRSEAIIRQERMKGERDGLKKRSIRRPDS